MPRTRRDPYSEWAGEAQEWRSEPDPRDDDGRMDRGPRARLGRERRLAPGGHDPLGRPFECEPEGLVVASGGDVQLAPMLFEHDLGSLMEPFAWHEQLLLDEPRSGRPLLFGE